MSDPGPWKQRLRFDSVADLVRQNVRDNNDEFAMADIHPHFLPGPSRQGYSGHSSITPRPSPPTTRASPSSYSQAWPSQRYSTPSLTPAVPHNNHQGADHRPSLGLLPSSQPILTTRPVGPGPERFYTILRFVNAQPTGVNYLLSDNENGTLWHGHLDGPMAYFTSADRPAFKFPVAGFRLGNKLMKPVAANCLFPLHDAVSMTRYLGTGKTDYVSVKWQDVFGAMTSQKHEYSCSTRLSHEIAICERMSVVPHPNVARYFGVIVADLAGGKRVTSVVFRSYRATLWEFANVEKLLRPEHVEWIVQAVSKGVEFLHSIKIVHGQVAAANVYLSYKMRTIHLIAQQSSESESKGSAAENGYLEVADIEDVVLGNFDQAMHCLTDRGELPFTKGIKHDKMRLSLLKEWLNSVLRNPKRIFSEEENSVIAKRQSGQLDREQLEELEKRLQD